MDLLAQVPADLPPGDVIDLGCGAGAVAGALAARLPDRPLIGVDMSPAMLDRARTLETYDDLIRADAAHWCPARPPALIFSNALCHWLGDHAALFARLAGLLAPGGALAVQMPRQYDAPSHALLRQIAARDFPDLFDFSTWQAPVSPAEDYARILAPLGDVQAWETSYVQRLDPVARGHPVRAFTQSTAMRPFLDKLDVAQAQHFTARYDSALADAYPAEPDGRVWFPFKRVFFILTPEASA